MTRRALSAAVLALACHGAAIAQNGPPESLLAGVDAVVFVCGPLDAKTAKDGADMQARLVQQFKLDPAVARKLASYTSTYNAEVNRLLSLPSARKAEACKNVF
jgi:hypothetical protein